MSRYLQVKDIELTFDEAMKDLVWDPRYKAIQRMADRRMAFGAWKENKKAEKEV